MIEQEFIKVAKQLQATDENEVVKVAGILSRLKNLFKQITNPHYREAVQNMQFEGGAMADAAKNLNKQLSALTDALRDGDVYKYKKAKNAIDNALQQFLSTRQNVDERADKIWQYTLQEAKTPGFIDRFVSEHQKKHPEYDVEIGKKYEGKTLRDFIAFRNVREIHICDGEGRTATKVLIDYVAQALVSFYEPKEREDFIKTNFSGGRLKEFKTEFSNAVLLGELIRVSPYEPSGNKKTPAGYTTLKVRSKPFEVPGVGAMVQATVTLVDKRGDITRPANISLMNTDKIDFIEGPQEDISPELETPKPPKTLQDIAEDIAEEPMPPAAEEAVKEEAVEKSVEEAVEKSVEEAVEGLTPEEEGARALQERLEAGKEFAGQEGVLSDVPQIEYKKHKVPKNLGDLVLKETDKEPEESPPETLPETKSSLTSTYLDIIKHADQVPYKVTKLSQQQFAEAMREGYKMAFGSDPTAEVLAGGWAQAILESGRPVKLPNNNVGNIKATSGWVKSGGPYFIKRTGEYTSEGKYYIEEGTKWRAYPTPAAGAAGYWKLIGGRYKKAISWMAAGDPTSASVALGLKGYYTAPIEPYAKSVSHIYNEFMTKIAPKMSGLESAPTAPPGPKPPVKKWYADYTKEERADILKTDGTAAEPTTVAVPKKDAPANDNEVDELITKLVASPLTQIVKRAILKKALPKSTSLITLASNDATAIEKMEFARVTSSILDNYLDIDSRVCRKGEEIEIHCVGSGTEMVLTGAIQAVCEMVSSGMKNQAGARIYATAIAGGASTFDEIHSNALIKNRKHFNMKRLANVG